MLWLAKEIKAENRIINHRKQRKEENARLILTRNLFLEDMVRNYCHSPLLPFSFRRSLEMANKCKAGVMEAYDVDLNHTFDQNDSENWWWE